jgi:endo-1,4-beta-xylanase
VVGRARQGQLLAAGGVVVLALVVGFVVVGAGRDSGHVTTPAPVATSEPPPAQSLRTLARAHDLRIGTAVRSDALVRDRQYQTVLAREFNSVTAEDAMKWANVERSLGRYDWAGADRVVDFAAQHDQQVYGHTLVWYHTLPAWLTNGRFKQPEVAWYLRRHITDEVSRYRGKVWAWDVVNEPLSATGGLRGGFWLDSLGPSYIADSFRWARAADPKAKLFLNEFDTEGVNAKSDALYRMVKGLLALGVPIDGVGFQTHWTTSPLPASLQQNLSRFAALGLDVAITEADARIVMPATTSDLNAQAKVYGQALDACLAVPRCVSFTVWGFTDKYSWIPRSWPGTGTACLLDDQFKTKPAYAALSRSLSRPAAPRK